MDKLFEGQYKIKFGENDEGKIVVIDEFGNLLIDDKKKFIWNNDNYNWMDNEEKNIIIVKSPISFIGSGDKYPVKFNIVKSNDHDGIYINGELELIDFEKLTRTVRKTLQECASYARKILT